MANFVPGQTFTGATGNKTGAQLDAHVADASFAAGSTALDQTTLDDNGSGKARVKTGGIGATQLASDAVTTVKILDDNVTAAKISDGAIDAAAKLASDVVTTAKILDLNVTTGKIADLAVTNGKLAGSITPAKLLLINETASLQVRAGSTSGTTNGSALLAISFPTAFASSVLTIVVTQGSHSAQGGGGPGTLHISIVAASTTTSGFTVYITRSDGSDDGTPQTNAAVVVNWIAIGT